MAARNNKNQKPADGTPKKHAASQMIAIAICSGVLILSPLFAAIPDEPVWSAFLTALVACAGAWRWVDLLRKGAPERPMLLAAADCLPALALLSLLGRWLLADHAAEAYVDVMVRGLGFWVTLALIFGLAATNRTRTGLYILAVSIFIGATFAASIGVQDYLIHVRHHESQWREFGTSTPDFYAGYLVISIPIALSLFLAAPSGAGKMLWLVFAVGLLLQLAALPTTGSRFALISLAVSLVVFAASLLFARRSGLVISKPMTYRLVALLILGVLGSAVFLRPILNRLQASTLKNEAHSGDFRVWTWKGTVRLIESAPLLGTGPSTFVYAYPAKAYVGFTRHAHNAYLQTASDLGIPALLVVLALFAGSLIPAFRALRTVQPPFLVTEEVDLGWTKTGLVQIREANEFLGQVAASDDRVLLCGFLAALAASLTQNFVDSDWFTFAGGVTLFAVAGVLVSFRRSSERPWRAPTIVAIGAVTGCVVIAGSSLVMGLAGAEAQSGDYVSAAQLEPLNSSFLHYAATKVYIPANNVEMTRQALENSAADAPDSSSYYRLGEFYDSLDQTTKSRAAYLAALANDPNSLAALLALAQAADHAGDHNTALAYYNRMAALEHGPYGQILAITEVTEPRYADADDAIGDDFYAKGDYHSAESYLISAETRIEQYVDEGGSAAPMRVAMTGGEPDPDLDRHMLQLYEDVTGKLIIAEQKLGDPTSAAKVKSQSASYLARFPGK